MQNSSSHSSFTRAPNPHNIQAAGSFRPASGCPFNKFVSGNRPGLLILLAQPAEPAFTALTGRITLSLCRRHHQWSGSLFASCSTRSALKLRQGPRLQQHAHPTPLQREGLLEI